MISVASALSLGMLSILADRPCLRAGRIGDSQLHDSGLHWGHHPRRQGDPHRGASKVQRTAIADKNGDIHLRRDPACHLRPPRHRGRLPPVRKNGIAVHINDQLSLPNIVLTVAGNDISVTVTSESTRDHADHLRRVSPTPSPASRSRTSTSRAAAPSNCSTSSPAPPTPATSPAATIASRPGSARTAAPTPSMATASIRSRSCPTARRSPTSILQAPRPSRPTST
jgi:hypothetical protein